MFNAKLVLLYTITMTKLNRRKIERLNSTSSLSCPIDIHEMFMTNLRVHIYTFTNNACMYACHVLFYSYTINESQYSPMIHFIIYIHKYDISYMI